MAAFAAWLRTLPAWQFWILIIAAAVVTLVALWLGIRKLRLARLIEDTPTARIRSAPQGFVELVGRAVMLEGEPVIAPLSGRYCVWYRYRVEAWRQGFGQRGRWRVVEEGESEALFALEDGSGRCIVDPAGAQVVTHHENTWRSDERLPPGHHDPFGAYRYQECRLEADDPLYALGWFQTLRGSGEDSLKAETASLLRRWKADRAALLQRFDINRDGEIDPKEWRLVRKQAERTVLRQRLQRQAPAAVNLLQRPPRRGQPYVLSSYPQAYLSRRYRWQGWGGLLVFVLFVAFIAWCLPQRPV
ncbi:hypothetical protein MIN45_P1437 [Methylomarinovum tepidoasis]|uniref:RING-type E3 ubiquitin transferase n=1 Tax=Methylomarinovum tepidoasis TaxID=2840183 RepID=A0AAU9C6A8_9GAMM|nr:GIDE domain-containing protein [Methylomarinovum sp. IN45]BCX89067.1 hypothetical protein MIN45_P1437 [Methylomarinovum sp. IN45]